MRLRTALNSPDRNTSVYTAMLAKERLVHGFYVQRTCVRDLILLLFKFHRNN